MVNSIKCHIFGLHSTFHLQFSKHIHSSDMSRWPLFEVLSGIQTKTPSGLWNINEKFCAIFRWSQCRGSLGSIWLQLGIDLKVTFSTLTVYLPSFTFYYWLVWIRNFITNWLNLLTHLQKCHGTPAPQHPSKWDIIHVCFGVAVQRGWKMGKGIGNINNESNDGAVQDDGIFGSCSKTY